MLATTADAARLEVVVANVRNGKGHVRVAACTVDTFLKESCQINRSLKATPGEVTIVMDVPPGVWAFQAYGDEDDNEEVTRNFLGFPLEGVGFSNDAPIRLGPPNFNDAAVRIGPGGGRIRFNLRYF